MEIPPKDKKWFKKQEEALRNAEGEILVKWGNFHFTTFFAQDELVEFIEETPPEQRQYYEVLTEGNPQRMFADLDGEGLTISDIDVLVVWSKLMQQVFKDVNLTYDTKKVRILKSKGKKISYHWSYLKSFRNSDEQKLFWKYVEHIIERDYTELCFLRTRSDNKMELMNVLDISVYSKNRAFRTYHSTKAGSDRVLEPVKFKDGKIKKITNFEPLEYLVLDTESTKFLDLNIPQYEKVKNKFLTQEDITKLINTHVPNVEVSEVSGRMFKLKNNGNRMCIINGEENISDNSYVIWRRDGLYFGCHDSGCEGQLKQIVKLGTIVERDSQVNWNTLRNQVSKIDDKEKLNQSIEDVVNYMNTKYTVVLEGSRVIVVYDRDKEVCPINPITQRVENDIMMMTKESLKDILSSKHMFTKIKDVEISPFKCWWSSANRNEKEKIVFEPYAEGKSPPRTASRAYNLWDGYAIKYSECQTVDKATLDTSHFLKHLLTRWCKNDIDVYNFLMGWISKTIQHPEIKLRSAIVIKGKEGAVKGAVIDLISRIIGEKYFFQPSSPDEILGGYNSSMSGKKLIFLDECVWGGDKQKSGTLKKLITEDRYTVKTKFLPDYILRNVMNLIMASNEEWCVPAGTNARRYLVLEILNELSGITKKNDEIIKDIMNEINSSEGVLSLAKTFYEWDLSDFNDRRPPQTDGLRTQKIHTFSPCQRFIHTALNEGEIGEYKFGSLVVKTDLFKFFKDESKDKHMSPKIFWDNVADMIGGEYSKTKPRKINGESKRCVALPSLKDAQKSFRLYIGDEKWKFDTSIEEDGDDIDDSDE